MNHSDQFIIEQLIDLLLEWNTEFKDFESSMNSYNDGKIRFFDFEIQNNQNNQTTGKDLTMPRGGARPGAGRKSKTEIQAIRNIIDDNIDAAQWDELFGRLREFALKGNMRAAQLLLAYRFGQPHKPTENDDEAPPIQFFEIVHPAPLETESIDADSYTVLDEPKHKTK